MKKRKFGLGSLTLPLLLIGVIWAVTFNSICIGDIVLNSLGVKAWSNGETGVHYTIFYSLIFFIPSFWFGRKYRYDFGAKAGRIATVAIGVVIVFSAIFFAPV